jgi:hypothetical protein
VIAARIVYAWVHGEGLIRTALRYIRPLPAELVLHSDAGVKAFPWVTVYLVLLNTVIFFTIPEKPALRWVFPPVGDYSLPHMLGSLAEPGRDRPHPFDRRHLPSAAHTISAPPRIEGTQCETSQRIGTAAAAMQADRAGPATCGKRTDSSAKRPRAAREIIKAIRTAAN